MRKRVIVSAINLLTLTSFLFSPKQIRAVENCRSNASQGYNHHCTSQSPIETKPKIILETDKHFNALPSCKEVNRVLNDFASSVKNMAKVINKRYSDQPNILDQIDVESIATLTTDEDQMVSSKDVFAKRFTISPIARQFYFNYLQSQEATRGSFDRPVINFQFDVNSNPGFSESLNGAISPIPSSAYSYTNETNPYLSIYYPFSLENLFATKSLKQQEKSSYYTFINQAVTDSLDTVSDFYDLKSNALSTILYTFQYRASADRVYRLKKLEEKGLSSRLDISRATITKTSQSTSLLTSKAALAQSYEKLAGDFLFPANFETTIFPQLSRGQSSACWSRPPSVSVESAIKTNPSLTALRYQIESSKLTRKSILAQNLPELSIGVSYEANNQWGNINGTGSTNDYYNTRDVVASATFNWNIYDFGQTFANAKSQKYVTDSLRNQLTQTLSQLETDILTNFAAYISSTQNVVSLAKASQEATKNYIDALQASQIGILSETDVDNIFNQLTSINSSLVLNIKSRNNAAVSIAKLVQTEGFDNIEFNQFLAEWKQYLTKASD